MLYVLFTFREIDCRGGLALAANVMNVTCSQIVKLMICIIGFIFECTYRDYITYRNKNTNILRISGIFFL